MASFCLPFLQGRSLPPSSFLASPYLFAPAPGSAPAATAALLRSRASDGIPKKPAVVAVGVAVDRMAKEGATERPRWLKHFASFMAIGLVRLVGALVASAAAAAAEAHFLAVLGHGAGAGRRASELANGVLHYYIRGTAAAATAA